MFSLNLNSHEDPGFNHIKVTDLVQLKSYLNLFKDESLAAIHIAGLEYPSLLDVTLVHNMGRVLKNNGFASIVLDYTTIPESDAAFLQALFAGAYLKQTNADGKILLGKSVPKVVSLQSGKKPEPKNVFGEYDYTTQTFKDLEKKSNPFQQVAQTGGEHIDEDSLLNDGIQIKQVQGCATKAKACKNCNCGRKENEQTQDKAQLIQDLQQGVVKSSCGSCYLGDAFRCANCPYKGLPAFKQGEKVVIANNNETNVEIEATNSFVQNGKVTLQI